MGEMADLDQPFGSPDANVVQTNNVGGHIEVAEKLELRSSLALPLQTSFM